MAIRVITDTKEVCLLYVICSCRGSAVLLVLGDSSLNIIATKRCHESEQRLKSLKF